MICRLNTSVAWMVTLKDLAGFRVPKNPAKAPL